MGREDGASPFASQAAVLENFVSVQAALRIFAKLADIRLFI
jgi:hypothetical protein